MCNFNTGNTVQKQPPKGQVSGRLAKAARSAQLWDIMLKSG